MRYFLTILAIISTLTCLAQAKHPKTFRMPSAPGASDSVTVKQYFFVMLTDGPKRDEIKDKEVIAKLQEGHMANISRLHKEGKLMIAGPFGDDKGWRGIFVIDADTEDEVKTLLATDPMIQAGRLTYDIHPWWTGMNSVFK